MYKEIIADGNVYLQSFEPNKIEKKNLDIKKLRILLNKLGFRPVNLGTKYIIESVTYCFENDIFGINRIEEAYKHTAKKYNVRPDTVLWDIDKAVKIMNIYADRKLLYEIFYLCEKDENITTRRFMDSFLDYLIENEKEYQK